MKKTTYDKANRKLAIITVLGITVVMLFAVMVIEGAAQSPCDDSINQGLGLMQSHNYTEALKLFDKAIEVNPQDAYAWWLKGNALRRLMRPSDAIDAYNAAIVRDSNDSKALNKGVDLAYLDRPDEALKEFDKSIEINSTSSNAWNNRGFL